MYIKVDCKAIRNIGEGLNAQLRELDNAEAAVQRVTQQLNGNYSGLKNSLRQQFSEIREERRNLLRLINALEVAASDYADCENRLTGKATDSPQSRVLTGTASASVAKKKTGAASAKKKLSSAPAKKAKKASQGKKKHGRKKFRSYLKELKLDILDFGSEVADFCKNVAKRDFDKAAMNIHRTVNCFFATANDLDAMANYGIGKLLDDESSIEYAEEISQHEGLADTIGTLGDSKPVKVIQKTVKIADAGASAYKMFGGTEDIGKAIADRSPKNISKLLGWKIGGSDFWGNQANFWSNYKSLYVVVTDVEEGKKVLGAVAKNTVPYKLRKYANETLDNILTPLN